MKKTFFALFVLCNLVSLAQSYPSSNISLVGMIHPNSGTVGIGVDDRRYAGCFGWKHPGNNKEFAIVGSSSGVYFIDISTPSNPTVSAFVGGKQGCTWREVQTYQNYAYIVSDDAAPNSFMIIDMTSLPSTVTVVHNGTTYFERGHTIFIEGGNMYIGSVTYSTGSNPGYSSMDVYSLATPTAPLLMKRLSDNYPAINTVHDMFVKNDTVYASCGYQGLHVYKYLPSVQLFIEIGNYTNYAGAPYNHSSYITANSKYLVFCDEVPASLPIRLVDVQNIANIQPMATFNPHPITTPHNPYVVGNNYAFVSCYQDGLNLYNISAPAIPFLAGYFDTHPQGGFNVGNYFGADYRGNWGAYPFLPSGLVIAVDMQNGVFVLDPAAALLSNSVDKNENENHDLTVYPSIVDDKFAAIYNISGKNILTLKNILGETVYQKEYESKVNEYIHVNELANGPYFVTLENKNKKITKKIIVNH